VAQAAAIFQVENDADTTLRSQRPSASLATDSNRVAEFRPVRAVQKTAPGKHSVSICSQKINGASAKVYLERKKTNSFPNSQLRPGKRPSTNFNTSEEKNPMNHSNRINIRSQMMMYAIKRSGSTQTAASEGD
jgi:hypothetical protein